MNTPEQIRRVLPLTWRLVSGYTLAVILTLSVSAVFLHHGLRRNFEVEDGELLAEALQDVRRAVLDDPIELFRARDLLRRLAGDRKIERFYARLLDDAGTVVETTPGGDGVLPPANGGPSPAPLSVAVPAVTSMRSPNGNPSYAVSAMVTRGPNRQPMVCQLALDTRHVEAWLDGYRRQLLIMIGGAGAATALLGWMITRGGLRPLQDISAAARRVTAQGLDERIGGKPWPSELTSLATEFDRMLNRLEVSFRQLSRFTADAAHEFRTPMNNLMGGTSLALSRPRTAREYQAILEANLEEYQRLNGMVESLLFLSRADHAQAVLKPEKVEAQQVLHEVADFFSAMAENCGVEIICSGGGCLTADPTLLRLAVSNLVSNALRHSERGGSVQLLAAASARGGLAITVADEGEGIARDHLEHVFDRFYRIDESRSKGDESSNHCGLGLSIVRTIMELHGGTVRVASESGCGAVFRLDFPTGIHQLELPAAA